MSRLHKLLENYPLTRNYEILATAYRAFLLDENREICKTDDLTVYGGQAKSITGFKPDHQARVEFFMLNKDHHTKKGTPIDYIYVDARRFVADDKLVHNNVLYLRHELEKELSVINSNKKIDDVVNYYRKKNVSHVKIRNINTKAYLSHSLDYTYDIISTGVFSLDTAKQLVKTKGTDVLEIIKVDDIESHKAQVQRAIKILRTK